MCAALLVPVAAATVRALRSRAPESPALDRYAQAARLLTGRADAGVEQLLDWLGQTVTLLEVPGLGTYGLTAQNADEVAAGAARASSTAGHPVSLSTDELAAAFVAATGVDVAR